MFILRKYVLRELIGPITISILFFSFLMLLRQLFSYAELLLEAGVGFDTFLEIIGIIALTLVIITIPMAALLGSLIGIGRLTSENEILAMRVAGISLHRIFLPVFLVAVLGSTALMWAGFDFLPNMLKHITDKQEELKFEVLTNLEPGRNYALPETQGAEIFLFYEERLPAQRGDSPYTLRMSQVALRLEGDAEDVVGAELDIGEKRNVDPVTGFHRRETNETLIFAAEGIISGDLDTREVTLSLNDGSIFPITVIQLTDSQGQDYYRRENTESEITISFDSLTRTIRPKAGVQRFEKSDPRQFTRTELKEILRDIPRERDGDPLDLYEADGDMPRAWEFWLSCRNELYQRYTLPWSLLAFVLIAVPLAVELRPRAKSFAFIVALSLIMLYYVMLLSAGAVGMTYSPLTLLAYMAPNLLIGGVGIILFWRVQR